MIHHAIEQQALRTPMSAAVVCGDTVLSYRELNASANRLADRLSEAGVAVEDRVALLMERSVDCIAAVLGVLKSGAAYVPLDPAWPADRIEAILRDSRVMATVTSGRWSHRFGNCAGQEVPLATIAADDAAGDGCRRGPVSPANAAYVIYTSGSTGAPRGVMVEHGSLMNLVGALRTVVYRGRSSATLRVGLNGPLAFDTSVKQIVQLTFGHTLHLIPEPVRRDPALLASFLRAMPLDVLDCTPTQLSEWIPAGVFDDATAPRLVLVGGEAISQRLWDEMRRIRGTAFWNVYGPTECTVDATACRVARRLSNPRIGRALPNSSVYVLDPDRKPVDAGVTGELCIAGSGVARGYLGNPAATAERFVPDPLGSARGARMYRTGDMVRRLPDEDLVFLGRADHQVKIRGFRIELAEIEAACRRHAGIREAAVVLRDERGRQTLVAYVVPAGDLPVNPREQGRQLRDQLRRQLPDAMVPAAVVWLDALPQTPNGKVNRRALPAPVAYAADGCVAEPRTDTEKVVADVWSEVLDVPHVGVHETLFDLGAHSLLAAQVAARLREAVRVELPLDALFTHDSVETLARFIDAARANPRRAPLAPLTRIPKAGDLPVSFAQERIWFVQQLAPSNVAYLFRTAIRIGGALDVPALERALTEIVRRHEIFRTTFASVNGRPRQTVHPAWPVTLPVVVLEGTPEDRQRALEDLQQREFRQGFDLGLLPLVRWTLVRVEADEHVLLVVEHHLIHDGWSLNVFLMELQALYSAFVLDRPSPLPELPVQFADFCAWQRSWVKTAEARQQLDYWRQRLADFSGFSLPTDRPRPPVQTFRGAIQRIEVPARLSNALREVSRRESVTLFMTTLAAFAAVLGQYAGEEEVCVGSAVANRRHREAESLIGMIVNNVVLRLNLQGDPPFRELLARVRTETLNAYANEDLPFDAVVDAVQPARDLSGNPLFQIAFSFHDALPGLEVPGGEIELAHLLDNRSAKFDINVIAIPRPESGNRGNSDLEGITFIWEYSTDLFEPATMERLAAAYTRVLEAVAQEPERPLSAITRPQDSEWRRILTWSSNARQHESACAHELFEDWARRTPDAVAILGPHEHVTYGELNERATRLAGRLEIAPGSVVAISMMRSPWMIASLLAVMKSGAAYLPMDPLLPEARLTLLIEDAGVSQVLTDAATEGAVADCGARVINVELLDSRLTARTGTSSGVHARVDGPAYVIYTSGSTGMPKGVAVSHRSVTNILRDARDRLGVTPASRMYAGANLSFDMAVLEIWVPLTSGASCWLASAPISAGAAGMRELTASACSMAIMTPSTWRALLDHGWRPAGDLTTISGGEAMPLPLAHELLRTGATAWNLYGPTEAAIYSTGHRLEIEDRMVPIGRPAAGTQVHVLDARMQPVPIGAVGELFIGGVGVAIGYLNRPASTAAAFVPDPYGEAGRRLYRTGDLVRYRSDGLLEFVGRRDNQVKVRGFRIELGEIEAALAAQPGVRHAAVIARSDRPDDVRLVAYVVPGGEVPENARARRDALRRSLRERLPEHMVPSAIVWMAEFPVTPNGKLDVRALPAPDVERDEPPRGPESAVERQLEAIWREVLGCSDIARGDDFFELGGHSLAAMQVTSRVLRDIGIELPLHIVFERPVLADMAEFVEAQRASIIQA